MTDLRPVFERLKHAQHVHPYPSYSQRQQQLQQLEQAVRHHQAQLCQAVSQDFGHRSTDESIRIEILPTIQGLQYHQQQLKKWLQPERRHVSWLFQPASNRIEYQPKGVVGIIVPWNYPIFLTLGPLMAAIAAGNRVMLKLSEDTPATNHRLQQLLATVFTADDVVVFTGDAQQAAEFSALPFDHLLFTGSTAVGRKVMQAAAKNLTPVTLELGGKSPAIVAADAKLQISAERLIFGKCANAGQTCVAPDYLWVDESVLDSLLTELQAAFSRLYPSFATNSDYSHICNARHLKRLQHLLQEAEQHGATIISCTEHPWQHYLQGQPSGTLPLQLVLNLPEHSALLQEEIFGPILPIRSYQHIETAIQTIQQGDRPLALYLFSSNPSLQQQVLQQTHSGGVALNDCLMQVAQDDLPFGGTGSSGIGSYHGKEGFLAFSHAKAVHKKGWWHPGQLIYPPYRSNSWFNNLLNWLLRSKN